MREKVARLWKTMLGLDTPTAQRTESCYRGDFKTGLITAAVSAIVILQIGRDSRLLPIVYSACTAFFALTDGRW